MSLNSSILLNRIVRSESTPRKRKIDPSHFHRLFLPNYARTSLHRIAVKETEANVYVKDESNRYGLPAFKVLGCAFAAFVELCSLLSVDPASTTSLESMRNLLREQEKTPVLVTATDGNHGRALAWFAGLVGVRCTVFVPEGVTDKSASNIQSEGAHVVRLDVDYDQAVCHAEKFALETPGAILIQDTAWKGYERVPTYIAAGYETLMQEVYEQCAPATPSVVICPVGVGSLAMSVIQASLPETKIIGVEADTAACCFESLQNGTPTSVKTEQTIMPGLNCGTVSLVAWPVLRTGLSAAVKITDEQATESLEFLHQQGIDAGPCGAASLAALHVLLASEEAQNEFKLDESSTIILLSTEGTKAAS